MPCICLFFFLFKQKTAYEMRISDWTSDVCSSDLVLDLSGQRLDDLNTRRAGSDNAHALIAKIHRLVRPPSGMEAFSLEVLQSRDFGRLWHGQHPGGRHEEPRPHSGAVRSADIPHGDRKSTRLNSSH